MKLRFLAVLASTLIWTGCSWHSYVISRGVRYVTGAPTRFHSIVPIHGGLRQYRVIEVQPLDNLILGLLPQKMENYIDNQIFKDLQSIQTKPAIIHPVPVLSLENSTPPAEPTLVLEGFVDDYDPGYAGLRLAELGFNHVAVTIRFQLRDKQTGEVMAAASITSQDNRATATTKAAINRIAKRIRGVVNSGYGADK